MKRKEDKWVISFRNRLEGYSEPVSNGVWESLEKELSDFPVKTKYPYRRLVVAAAIFLAVLSSVSLLLLHTPQAEYVKEARTKLPVSEPSSISGPILPQKKVRLIAKLRPSTTVLQKQDITSPLSKEEKGIIAEEEIIIESVDLKADKQEVILQHQKPDPMRSKSGYADTSRPVMNNSREGEERNWSVGVSVGNSPLSVSSGQVGFGNLPADMKNNEVIPYSISNLMLGEDLEKENSLAREAYRQVLINNINKETFTDIKHRMPVTIGVSFRFELSRQFSVETGINYTLLSSDLKSGNETDYYVKEQKLHYLGIPVKGNWKFLDKRHFSLYLTAGGAFEKCVSGTLKSNYVTHGNVKVHDDESQRVKPLQWSVTSAVGAQYNATRHIGLFVEPGIVYYFDDGSTVETIRKEKPFNFNLQMGLRFTY